MSGNDKEPGAGRPESMDALIGRISPEVYDRLRSAVELGRWSSGERLTPRQLEHCMQAVIAYEHHNLPVSERTGFIRPRAKTSESCESPPGENGAGPNVAVRSGKA